MMPSKMQKKQILFSCKWIKCKSCHKIFTQTIYKNKMSSPVCPYCKKIN
jgi:hypothetical protein